MTKKREQQRKRGITTSRVQPSLPKKSFFGEAASVDPNKSLSLLSIVGDSYPATASSVSVDDTIAVDTSEESAGTDLAEDVKIEALTSSEPQNEVAGKSKDYTQTVWALLDKYFERLLPEYVCFLPFVPWIVILGFIVVSDSNNQLLNSVEEFKAFIRKGGLVSMLCLMIYFPIIFLQRGWGWIKKAFCLIVVVLILAAVAILLWALWPSA